MPRLGPAVMVEDPFAACSCCPSHGYFLHGVTEMPGPRIGSTRPLPESHPRPLTILRDEDHASGLDGAE